MLLQSSNCLGDQYTAISHVEGPAMVFAGPGTGKTTTVANRISRLILDKGYDPSRILCLTFNKDAQLELEARIASMLAAENYTSEKSVQVMTYHKFGYTVSSQVLQLGKYKDGSVLADPTWLIKAILGGQGTLSPSFKGGLRRNGMDWQLNDGYPDPKQWLKELERPQQNMVAPSKISSYFIERFEDSPDLDKWLQFYVMFRSELNKMGKITFSDMLYVAWLAMANKPDELQFRLSKIASMSGANAVYNTREDVNYICQNMLSRIQNAYDIVCVDESQDTDPLQGWVATQIAKEHKNIMVVGDMNQSIYAFRGATPDFIPNMMNQFFKGYQVYNLDHTRRCATAIVDAANKVISYNPQNENYKPLKTARIEQGKVLVNVFDTDSDQATAFADEIALQVHEHDARLSDFAILCRTKRDIMNYEPMLFQRGLHYRVAGGGSVYSRKEIKIAMGYMMAALGIATAEELLPCINIASSNNTKNTHFLGMEAEKALVNWVALHPELTPMQAIRKFVNEPVPYSFDCPRTMQRGLKTWLDVVDSIIQEIDWLVEEDADKTSALYINIIRDLIVDPYLKREYEENDEEGDNPLIIIYGLSQLADKHANPEVFTSLIRQLQEDGKNPDTLTPAITLSTGHRAKGLEWDTVFLSSCHDGQWPHKNAVGENVEIGSQLASEERRLFFVAVTRAKNVLHIGAVQAAGIFIAEAGLTPIISEDDNSVPDELDVPTDASQDTSVSNILPFPNKATSDAVERLDNKSIDDTHKKKRNIHKGVRLEENKRKRGRKTKITDSTK